MRSYEWVRALNSARWELPQCYATVKCAYVLRKRFMSVEGAPEKKVAQKQKAHERVLVRALQLVLCRKVGLNDIGKRCSSLGSGKKTSSAMVCSVSTSPAPRRFSS
jgi:hypothetical protein